MVRDVVQEIEVGFVGVRSRLGIRGVRRGTASAVVDVGSGVRDSLSILDIEVGFNTGVGLIITTFVDENSGEILADGVSAVFLEESLAKIIQKSENVQ